MKKLKELGEFGWLKTLLPRLYWPGNLQSQLCIGPGDDAGVVRLSTGKRLVATTDAMVEGIHFERRWFSWEDLGYKVLAVNLSDLAAMGNVKPLTVLVTAAFPGDTPVDNVDKFYTGMHKCAQRWKVGFLGGDTVGSKKGWFVSVTALGEADPRGLIERRGARSGDDLVASGPLGLAAAGLEVLQTGKPKTVWMAPLMKAFNRPEPRFREGQLLGKHHLATSLMDCSDGLEASVKLLSDMSGVGMEVDLDQLPIAPALERWARSRSREAWRYALQGGEDYELIFTVNPANWPAVRRLMPKAARIGRVQPRKFGVRGTLKGRSIPLERYGYAHF